MSNEQLSPALLRSLRRLGQNLQTARRKRHLSQADIAAKMGVSLGTVQRLEKGDAGVSIGSLAMAFMVLGGMEKFNDAFDPLGDPIGLMLDAEKLPQRVRRRKSVSALTGQSVPPLQGMDL